MTKARQNAESAILGALTALIYTFQMIYGIGTAISYLAVFPLVYAMNQSRSEWLRIVVVASVIIFAFNDLGGSLFFILFIVPMSISIMMKINGLSIFLAEGPLFWSLVLILYKLGWIVGFEIPPLFRDWWVLLVFLFCAFVIAVFSKIAYLTLKVFDFRPRSNSAGFEFFAVIIALNSLAVFVVYGFSIQALFNLIIIMPLMMIEPLKLTVAEIERVAVHAFQLLYNKLTR